MKSLKEYIFEHGKIDQTWIDNEKPVITRDGRQAIILSVDISKVPNILKGQVKVDDRMCDYTWDDQGKCITATDIYGNFKQPNDNDTLVKNI